MSESTLSTSILKSVLICVVCLLCSTISTAQSTTYACYTASPPHTLRSPGDVRIVSSPAECVVGESAISWEVFPVGGSEPVSINFDGTNLWVLNPTCWQCPGTITKLRASDGAHLGTFPAGHSPERSVIVGDDIWITNRPANRLTRLRLSNGSLVATYNVRGGPAGLAFDGTTIWVSYYLDNSVSRLRPSDGAELSNTPGVFSAFDILFDGTDVWVANNLSNGTTTKLRGADGAILGVFFTGRSFPGAIGFDGNSVWVSCTGSQAITKLNGDGTVTGIFSSGFGTGDYAFDGANMWVPNEDVVLKYRASDGALLGSFPNSRRGGGAVFDGTYVWVTNQAANTVTRYHDLGPVLPPPAELVAWYTADGDLSDSLGANNASATNAISFEAGHVCDGVRLSPTVGFIEIPDSQSLRNQRLSVSAWVKPDGAGPNDDWQGSTFIQKNIHPPAGDFAGTMGMWWSAQDHRFRFSVGSINNTITSANTFTVGQFYQVTGTYDGATLSLYVNGNLEAQTSLVTTIPYAVDIPWTIGSSGSYYRSIGYPRTWNGVIDEVKIYNGALTPNEILQLFESNDSHQCPVLDGLAPNTSTSVSQQPNPAGWNNSNVAIALSASDNSDGSGVRDITYSTSGAQTIAQTVVNGASANLLITAEGVTTITYFASDVAGNVEEAQSLTVRIDKSAPHVSCGSADGAWHPDDVSVRCNVSDGISGLADPGDSSFDLTTSVPANTETANASTDSRSVCDVAGNCANAGPISENRVDKKAPDVTITAPTAGTYLLNQSITVDFNCTDGASGVGTCTGTSPNGGSLDTASVGTKVFTVNATDNVGNTSAPNTLNYTVNFGLAVLFDQSKAHKSGSTVPIKITLVDANGVNVSAASVVIHAVSVVQVGTEASPIVEDAGNSNPDLDFRYDASLNGYIFNLKTTGYGTGSYVLNFVAGNGPTTYSVGFQVRQ